MRKKRGKNGGFLDWLVKVFRPGHHIVRIPTGRVKKDKITFFTHDTELAMELGSGQKNEETTKTSV